jgi:L-glyceraldehyde 3-phosphate reductase
MTNQQNEFTISAARYTAMQYRRCGDSGLKLPLISLGLWHNFGEGDPLTNCRKIIFRAFNSGVTHFDLANNYGPPPGSAEETFGKILKSDFRRYRDEMIISSKAGYTMWDGPYGDWGSRKYLMSSLDQSLRRMQLNYVDIFYHHRPDPDTPLEETMMALHDILKQGKALYAGISNYKTPEAQRAINILKELGTPCLIHQPKYSMLERWVEPELLKVLGKEGVGCIPFSPLAQGMLTNKYLKGIPQESRAAKPTGFLKVEQVTKEKVDMIAKLNEVAAPRNQTLAQMAIAWLLKDERITSVLIGASNADQVTDCVNCQHNLAFSSDELTTIEKILNNNPVGATNSK